GGWPLFDQTANLTASFNLCAATSVLAAPAPCYTFLSGSSYFRITDEGSMSLSQVHYLPLAPPFFFILVGLFVAILVLIQLGVLRYAYMRGREPAEVAHSCPHCGKASRRDHWNESLRPRVQSAGALMSRTAISGLVCTTFLVLPGFPAVPQEPAAKGAATESGQQTFNNACRTCHTTKEGDNRLGPNLHNIIGRKAGSLQNYGYSSAMKGADFVWDKEKLDRFIAK